MFRSRKRRSSSGSTGARVVRRKRFNSGKKKWFRRSRGVKANYKGFAAWSEKKTYQIRINNEQPVAPNNSNGYGFHIFQFRANEIANWPNLAGLYEQYQLRGVAIKLYPICTNVEASSAGLLPGANGYETTRVCTKYDPTDNVSWANPDAPYEADCMERQFTTRPLKYYVKCRPQIELSSTGDVKIPPPFKHTWIPTDNPDVLHRGMKLFIQDWSGLAWPQGLILRATCKFYFRFKQQQ